MPEATSNARRTISWAPLLILLALPLLALKGCQPAEEEPADLTLLYTGNVHGYIEPCGCAAGQIGGIDRIAGYVSENMAALGDRGLFIDTGDLLAKGLTKDEPIRQQLLVKARGFFEVWRELGCSAIALGEAEVSLGVAEVAALSEQYEVPVLCANLVDDQGERPLPGYVIVERGGMRVGIFSVMAAGLREVEPKKKAKELERYPMNKLLAEQGLQLEPWRERAAEVIAELRPQVDLLVCASHLGYDLNVQLARAHPDLDLVVGGHFGSSEGQTDLVAGTPVLTTRINGSRVGRMEWWLPEPEDYLGTDPGTRRGELVNVSEAGEARIQLEVASQAYEDLAGMERKHGSAKWENLRITQERLHELASETLLEAPSAAGENRFSHNQVPMHRGVPRSNLALAAVDQYHRDTEAHWLAVDGATPSGGGTSSLFVGASSCVPCHAAQYEFWLGTRHSRAFATLEATTQQYDAECIGCHSIGFGVTGGFDLPTRSEGFRDVQCAACHGTGGGHAAGGRSYLMPGLINRGMNGCARCHKGEHDPTFEQTGASKLLKVACPPIGGPGSHSEPMVAAYLTAAADLLGRSNPNYDLISKAYNEAGELDRALEAARDWVRTRPNLLEARLTLGERALNSSEFDLAVRSYLLVTNNQPDNPRAWMGLAFAHFGLEDFEEALEAARETYALSPSEGMAARIVAMSQMALGQAPQAREHMERHLEFHPGHEAYLADLMAQLSE